MKLTPGRKKFLTLMASTPGRWIRAFAGATLGVVALTQGGAALFLLIPATLMIATGVLNYCPVGPMFGFSGKSGELLSKLQTYDLK